MALRRLSVCCWIICFVVVIICSSTEKKTSAIIKLPFRRCRRMTSPLQIIRIRVNNGDKMGLFSIRLDATIAELYSNARAAGVMDPLRSELLTQFIAKSNRYERRIIRDDASTKMMEILDLPSVTSLVMPRQVILTVFAAEQIVMRIKITKGDITMSFRANAGTTTNAVYQKVMEMGMIDNHYQFALRLQNDPDRVLVYESNPVNPVPKLVNIIDPKNHSELRLIVSPIPEGVLLFAMFRDMAPNRHIPSWNYAQFCLRNPWHMLCSSLSRRIEYEDDQDADEPKWTLREEVEIWKNDIFVTNVPMWCGVLHLEHTPRSVRSMTLKGDSVTIDFQSLRYSLLRELTLDFVEDIELNIAALFGLSLEILRLRSHSEFRLKMMSHVLEMLTTMRAQNESKLETIVLGRRETRQQIIWYNAEVKAFHHYEIHSVSIQ